MPHLAWQEAGATSVAASPRNLHREDDVRIINGEVTLAGTLLLPRTSIPCPAVVLVHGSIPSLRDYYRVFAQLFVQQGIAALIYDKRDMALQLVHLIQTSKSVLLMHRLL